MYLAISQKRKIILKNSSEETARFYFFPGKVNVTFDILRHLQNMLCDLEANHVFEENQWTSWKSLDMGRGARVSTRVTHLPREWLPSWSGGIGKIWQLATEAIFISSTHQHVACVKTPLPPGFFPEGRGGLYTGYPLAGLQPISFGIRIDIHRSKGSWHSRNSTKLG